VAYLQPHDTNGTPPDEADFSTDDVRESFLVLFQALYDLKKAPLDREELRSIIEEAAMREGDPFGLRTYLGLPPRRRLFFIALSDLLSKGLLERSLKGFELTDEARQEAGSSSGEEQALAQKAAEAVLGTAA
jgi:hypothetical protein